MQKISVVILFLIGLSGCVFNQEYVYRQIPLPKAEPVRKERGEWIPAKTQTVWVNPTVDETGAFIDGHYKQVVVEPGHWALQEVSH